MKFFTRAFWVTAAENAIVAGGSAFAASGVFTSPPAAKNFVTGGIAAGMAALYSVIKQVGGVQTAKSLEGKS